jgi:hypothetical protein
MDFVDRTTSLKDEQKRSRALAEAAQSKLQSLGSAANPRKLPDLVGI